MGGVTLNLVARGWRVIVTDIKVDGARAVAALAKGTGRAEATELDVMKLEDTKALVERIVKDGGRLDALVNIAGGGRAGTMDQTDAILRDLTARLHPRWEDQRTTLRLWNSYLTLLLIIGLGTRWAAFIIAINTATAFVFVHHLHLSGERSGEVAWIYLAGALALFLSGAGKFSVDHGLASHGGEHHHRETGTRRKSKAAGR